MARPRIDVILELERYPELISIDSLLGTIPESYYRHCGSLAEASALVYFFFSFSFLCLFFRNTLCNFGKHLHCLHVWEIP